jgi:4-hydroxy-3-polyprenylbenzoate decarboxylase
MAATATTTRDAPATKTTASEGVKPVVQYNDLREWMAEADKLGELREVEGLSWEKDIGLCASVVQKEEKSPCVVFTKVPGSLPGSRVLTNFFGGRRMNMSLGLPLHLSKLELSDAFRQHFMIDMKKIPMEYVETGPVLQNTMRGDDIDVTAFPTPIWHPEDGGRYIGTGAYLVTRDPDEGWINCGVYRVMVQDKKSVGFYISPGKHGHIQMMKYEARKERMPVVIVVGGDPMAYMMSGIEVPYGTCEYDVIGGIRGTPCQVIKGPMTGLPFPANAEIVIEGFLEPGARRVEGPFAEWTGYYSTHDSEEPLLDIKAIHYRNDPIILGCPHQMPPDESMRYLSVVRSALLRENITKAGVPDVTGAWMHEVGGGRFLVGVSIKQRYGGHARQAGHIACQCHLAAYSGRYVVVTDEDVDVSNLEELIWAMCTRSDPATSIDFLTNAWSTPLDPRIDPTRRAEKNFTNSRAIIDACRPWHWRDKYPTVISGTLEDRREAKKRFAYLLK